MTDAVIGRIGIVAIAAAATLAAWCCFQPGFEVYENNADDCFGNAFSHHEDEPCVHREWYAGTRRAGSDDHALGVVLAALPGLIVGWRPSRRAFLTWAGVVWGCLVFVTIARGATESRGCIGEPRLVTLWPRVALGYATIVVLLGPVMIAGALYAADYARRRPGSDQSGAIGSK